MRNSGIIRANEPALDYLLRGLKSADIAARVRLHLLNALDEGLPTEETVIPPCITAVLGRGLSRQH